MRPMQIIINDFVSDRITYILEIIKNSLPGKRRWYKSRKFNSGNDYSITERSTFPDYIKFAYVKKPKNWYILTDDEKKKEDIYFQYNTKNITRCLNKILKCKMLTELQQLFIEILFYNFYKYEEEWEIMNNEKLFDDMKNINMDECPF